MSRPLTLMAVHAHPDDEATSTGGVLARYAAEGVTTVLVTCTDGALGDAGTVKPGEEGHSTEEVVAQRAAELAESCRILGVTHAHQLGYHDSGMMGWPQNDAPGAFWTTPLDEPVARLAELVRRHRPDVVVTYDENGFYGHPDHIQAHRVTVAALEAAGSDARLYYSTVRRSDFARFGELMRAAGEDVPEPEEGQEMPVMGSEDVRRRRRRRLHAVRPGQAGRAGRARQPGGEHLLPQAADGGLHRGHGPGVVRAGPPGPHRHRRRRRPLRRPPPPLGARATPRTDPQVRFLGACGSAGACLGCAV